MPMYEFICYECDSRETRLLSISMRDSPQSCAVCKTKTQMARVLSVPSLSVWDSSRSFPISPNSEGLTFPSKAAYQKHMSDTGIAEVSTDAPKRHKPAVWRKVYGR